MESVQISKPELVLGALGDEDDEDDAGGIEEGFASNEEEETIEHWYEVELSNGLVLACAQSMSFFLRTPENMEAVQFRNNNLNDSCIFQFSTTLPRGRYSHFLLGLGCS